VEFGLLGPLVVRSGGVRVTVSAGKQRVLLAALLVCPNQVVPAAELARFVWEGSPPETARVTLQNYVKRLRQAMGPAGYERIVTRPAGYLIEVGAGELDVARFGELAAAGRAAARAGAWEDASAQLGAALALWRGQPLADVPSRALALGAVPRLAEMRLDAAEAWIDAELNLGRHRDVVAELQSLAAAEPLRERLHELLMLALYRSGQQATALAVYRRARRRLIDEVGIEPGPGLRGLNLQILRSDRALLLAAPPCGAPGRAGAAAGGTTGAAAGRTAGGTTGAAAGRTAGGTTGAAAGRTAGGTTGAAAGGVGAPRQRSAVDDSEGPLGALRPSLLPAAVPDFTGRARELQELRAVPGQPGRPPLITVIDGTAGVGKTALAVHWARHASADFPDGQLYVNLRGFGSAEPLPPTEALRVFLNALQVPAAQIPATLDGRHALYRSLVDGKKILILLDNARDPAQVRPLLPATPTARVLITSRSELASLAVTEGAGQICLDVLTTAEARQMLAQRVGPARIAAEPQAADELIALCAQLPLALAITASRAAAHPHFTLAALTAELRDARGRLDALSTGEDATDVRAVFSWSYQSLQPAAARMFRLLGLHPGPDITAEAAASLVGLALPEARRLVRELTRGHLLAEPAPGRYAFHDLLRAYAAEQAAATDDRDCHDAAIGRVLDHYLHTAYSAAVLLNPSREPITLTAPRPGVTPERPTGHQQALEWFEAEHHVLLAAVALAADTGSDTHAWQLPRAMADYLHRRGHWDEAIATQRTALGAATRLGDQAGQAGALLLLGLPYARLGDHDQARAVLTQGLDLYRQLGDRAGEARTHLRLGSVSGFQGRGEEALSHAEQALALSRAIGDRAGEAAALNDVGCCQAELGDPRQARGIGKQALDLQRALGNRAGEAVAWDSLGYAEHQLGRLSDAASCYRHALRLFRELGARVFEAGTLTRLGDTQHAAQQPDAARDAWQQALEILVGLRHPDSAGVRARLRQLDSAGAPA